MGRFEFNRYFVCQGYTRLFVIALYFRLTCFLSRDGGEVLPKILGRGVPHGSQNPDPISDQNI